MKLIELKGIGPKLREKLIENGIDSVESLLFTFPKSYNIYSLTSFSYFEEFNVKATIIDDIKQRKLKNVTKISFEAMIDGLKFNCSMFNMNYVVKAFKKFDDVVIIGSYNNDFKEVTVTKLLHLNEYKEGITPIYNIEGITNLKFQKLAIEAMEYYNPREMIIPNEYFSKYNYKCGKELLNDIHNPKAENDYINAINALKYSELLSFSLKLDIVRENQEALRNDMKNYDIDKLKTFINFGIHFDLTEDQKKAVNDICRYLKSDIPLNMLLEGDVGCGKTIVALITSYAVKTSGYQTLVIVPTESLAKQHYKTFCNYLLPFDTNVALLTSSTKTKERKEILEKLNSGEIDIIIGTHSLINDEVIFKKLGYVVCDEQHKFGVEQRKKIREKGNNPDTLYMTATPIPRTLQLTIFNDMVLETIKTSPKNRKKVNTYVHTYKDYLKVLDFVKSEIDDGRQAYFVSPLVEDNSSDEVSVERMKNDLEKYFKNLKIGLLHGKLSDVEKNEVLEKFMNKELDILASTTVIEVGIDNPNASVMVILDSNHFGLSTLHQLRGRVGRGEHPGYTFLMTGNRESMERLKILEETQDGFLISEQDLKDRGPGDFLGTEQSGKIKFSFANIFRDNEIFNNARKDSKELIKIDKIKKYYESKLFSEKFD